MFWMTRTTTLEAEEAGMELRASASEGCCWRRAEGELAEKGGAVRRRALVRVAHGHATENRGTRTSATGGRRSWRRRATAKTL